MRRLSTSLGSSRMIWMMPMAARRTAKGSEEPVGGSSMANMPQIVSSLSETATTLPTMPLGSSSLAKRGR